MRKLPRRVPLAAHRRSRKAGQQTHRVADAKVSPSLAGSLRPEVWLRREPGAVRRRRGLGRQAT
jgi:hypothetical protein